MRIMYEPKEGVEVEDKETHEAFTNLGPFKIGQAMTVGPEQEEEAARLVEIGHFVEVDADDKPVKKAKKAASDDEDEPKKSAKKK
jgi:hypothetical protein